MKHEEIIQKLTTYLDEKGATDIKVLDISKLSTEIDTFIIATADNERLAKAICDSVSEKSEKELGLVVRSTEGLTNATWILIDFGEIVIHVFTPKTRAIYDLEGLWERERILTMMEQ